MLATSYDDNILLTLASLCDTIGSCDRVTRKPRGCRGAASITRMARLQLVRTTAPIGRLVPAPSPTGRSLPALPGVCEERGGRAHTRRAWGRPHVCLASGVTSRRGARGQRVGGGRWTPEARAVVVNVDARTCSPPWALARVGRPHAFLCPVHPAPH